MFSEIRFPDDIAYGSTGGPAYATDIVMTQSGHEYRNAAWAQARARYNVAHGVKNKEQLDTLIAFFRARRGKWEGFRFRDWADYEAHRALIGTGDGQQTQFQLVKHYTSGTSTETRIITKPVEGSVVLETDKGPLTIPYTVDTTNGEVTLTKPFPLGLPLIASFLFDVPVRFDIDCLSVSLDDADRYSWGEIPLVEVRS